MCEFLYGSLFAFIADWPLPVAVKDVIDVIKIPVVSTSIITTDTDSTIAQSVLHLQKNNWPMPCLHALIVYNSWTDVVYC